MREALDNSLNEFEGEGRQKNVNFVLVGFCFTSLIDVTSYPISCDVMV